MFHRHDVPSAGTRSGITWRRQPNTMSGSIWPSTWRDFTAAGFWAFRIVSGGAHTVRGSSDPALLGIWLDTTQPRPNTV